MDKTLSLNKTSNNPFTAIGKDRPKNLDQIKISNAEIVKINDELIHYPCDRISLSQSHFKKSTHENNESDPRKPLSHDKVAQVQSLHPPIIINIREDAKSGHRDTREALTETELNYLHRNKSPAVLFIHGFNIPYGEYSPQIVGMNKAKLGLVNCQSSLDEKRCLFELSSSSSTIQKSQKILEEEFNHSAALGFKLSDEDLNGSGAHNWFTHMENNINRAAEKIKANDYSRYRRIINVAWSGDVPPAAYLDAEEKADEAGKSLLKLVKQLVSEKIEIYLIAHSLGCRVALKLMEVLAQNSHENSLKNVFLWQAAVPNYSLSNKLSFDNSVKYNAHFPNAHLSSDKITVLYSKNDWVLRYHYWLINRIGLSPKEFFSDKDPCQLLYRFMDKDPLEVLAFTKLLEGDIHSLAGAKQSEEEFDLLLRIVKECYRLPKTAQAMGYQGVNLKDPFMQKLVQNKKLILVNQPFLRGHSDMKIPNDEVMSLAYKRWIVNKERGIVF